jgi:hypothetical protein
VNSNVVWGLVPTVLAPLTPCAHLSGSPDQLSAVTPAHCESMHPLLR